MKSLIRLISITSIFFAACDSKSNSDISHEMVGTDSSAVYKNNVMADTALTVTPAPGTVVKRVETRNADGSVVTTTTTTSSRGKEAAKINPATRQVSGSANARNTTTTTPATTSATPVAAKKKGWSSRAKGAAIGGVGGAVAGAVISKKKGKGALIGGAVGAAGGYIIGNEKDKKQGR